MYIAILYVDNCLVYQVQSIKNGTQLLTGLCILFFTKHCKFFHSLLPYALLLPSPYPITRLSYTGSIMFDCPTFQSSPAIFNVRMRLELTHAQHKHITKEFNRHLVNKQLYLILNINININEILVEDEITEGNPYHILLSLIILYI